MSATLQQPVGPVVYSIAVNGVPIYDTIINVSLDQSWGRHDLALMRIEYNRAENMAAINPWPDNAQIQMVWGRKPGNLLTWYGYVNHYEMMSNAGSGTHNLQITYVCIGTSKPMNAQTSRFWGSVTSTYAAKVIAQKYGFRCVVSSGAPVIKNLTQAAMSDFQFMSYLAQKTGYRFWVSGGTMYFVNPIVYFAGSQVQGVSTFRQDKLQWQQDTMRDFTVLRGDNLPGAVTGQRQVTAIDSTTGKVVTVSSGSGVNLMNTTRVATSLQEAQSVLAAWDGLSQFWIGAQAEFFGDQYVYPGKLVYLDGNALPGNNIGFWLVGRAKHLLVASGTALTTNDMFTTQVDIIRNEQGPTPNIQGVVTIKPEFVECNNNSGTWASKDQRVIIDGIVNGA